MRLALALALAPAPAAHSDEPVALPEYVIAVARSRQDATVLAIPVQRVEAARLRAEPTIDEALRDDPAFSLFRRNSSLSANPTAQGVSLRGVGPSGASRTAVILDDIPLNDPFGGWVTWGQIPSLSLSGAEIVHGGGSSTWGNNALGGTVALASAPPADPMGALALQAGSDGLLRGELTHTQRVGPDSVRVDLRGESYDGFQALRPRDRGAVDHPLDHRHRLGQIAWRHPLDAETDATLTVRAFDEDRGNGTRLQANATTLTHAALGLARRDGGETSWKAGAWLQRQEFSSFFSAVSTDRMSETPANDQYAVPATAAGFHASRVVHAGEALTVVGIDGRWVDGETRENYLYRDGAFTQRRFAGGTQRAAGLFVHHDRPLNPTLHLSGALRGDFWSNTDGHTREISLSTGATTRDEHHPDRDGFMLSPRLGIALRPDDATVLRAAVYRAFRVPTLNEYYRPFRVGNTSTLANPSLQLETLHGIDLGLERRFASARLEAGVFWNRLDDGVGNVTLSTGPGGTTRQRRNLDEIRVAGFETAATWTPVSTLSLRAAALVTRATVERSRDQPALEGKRLAQVPDYTMTLTADWQATADTSLRANMRFVGRQYDDDENHLPLAAACVVDLRLEHRVNDRATCFVALDNLLDHAPQTSRSAAGMVTYDQPRSVRSGCTVRW